MAISLAARRGHREIVSLLVTNRASLKARDDDKLTPLILATIGSHADCTGYFLRAGSRVDATDIRDCTPLILASESGYFEVVKVLLSFKADVGISCKSRAQAIHTAAKAGSLNVGELLISRGASINAVSEVSYETPLYFALDRSHHHLPGGFSSKG
ncbi:ankyrin repeat-containing domain protein [Lasiosphaeria hispida]|uniref:Ankyrin repeat-containing domain protein n=1 Tax=Lasiosphaeria hispida TaxID=260671 RepID=A0AAJ0H7Q1_9PEZI|nr:ankyrin repeat-containing domain protein [Lasiosphaeria hispida]